MNEERLGRRLQAARVQAGLTQQSLCQKANLSYSTLTKIERGAIKSPSIFTIQSIATALGIGLDELMGGATAAGTAAPHTPKLHSKSGVSFVYFDINGCLVRFFHGAFSRLSEQTGASPDVIEMIFWHYNDLVCRGEMDMPAFNQKLAEELGIHNVDWMDYYLDAVEPIPVMHDLVRWAAERYHVGLLTNIMPGFVDELKKRSLIPNIPYDTIIDSSKVKAIKPEAEIYKIASERANCPASQILLVDDSRVNLMAAEKQGWHVLWFDDYRPDESAERVRSSLEPAE
ncbi:MAG TPA: HAD-IA family hydrolase [Candidatus Saccharimonadales bacterium]|nr:HAD-IA family hydrolase [Candidatus Saccharimonadales bacterium]